ncbi:Acetyltransferase (GNAT) family protein [compost metagenome]
MNGTIKIFTEQNSKMQNSEKQIIVDILRKSFQDNKSVNFVVKQDNKREVRINKLMEYSYFQGETFGKIYLSKDQNACAIVLIPSKKKTTLKSILWDLKLVFKCMGISNVSKVLKRESEIKKHHPDFPFLHLWYIGVNPEFQGKARGTELMARIMHDAKELNLPIYLETSTPRNFPFYEKLGFKLISELDNLGYPLKMYLKDK